MDFNFKIGDVLLIHLISGQQIQAEYRGGTDNKINLTKAVDVQSKQEISAGYLSFRQRDVLEIKVISSNDDSGVDNKTCTKQTVPTTNIKMDESEYERLRDMCKDHIYIFKVDRKLESAIEYLSNCENISCVPLGNMVGGEFHIDLFAISSWDRAYIFDVKEETMLFNELKSLFESNYVCKVVHYSRSLVKCLHNRHNIKLKNIFDTGVADKMITKEENRNIMECLVSYFNFPPRLFPEELMTESDVWSKRPLEDETKVNACKLSAYLITLKNFLLDNHILSSYYKASDSYANFYKNKFSFVPFGLKNDVSCEEIEIAIKDINLGSNENV